MSLVLILPDAKRVSVGGILYIGRRGGDNDLVIPNDGISDYHAQILNLGGDYVIWSREKDAVTRVNGNKCGLVGTPKGLEIGPGDTITLGRDYEIAVGVEEGK